MNHIIQPSNAQRGASNTLPYFPLLGGDLAEAQFYQTSYPLQFLLIQDATAQVLDTYEMNVLGRTKHVVAVSCAQGTTYNATVLVEGTLDGINWVTLESVITPQILQLEGLYQSIRVSIPTYVSGTITVAGITQRG